MFASPGLEHPVDPNLLTLALALTLTLHLTLTQTLTLPLGSPPSSPSLSLGLICLFRSLDGKLSSVRVVFLYRYFLQLINYFCGLTPPVVMGPSSASARQPSRGLARVDGEDRPPAPAVPPVSPWWSMKLDVALEEPMLVWPKHSQSPDGLEISMESLKARATLTHTETVSGSYRQVWG